MADYGINTGKVIYIGVLSVILTVVAVVGLQALYYWQVHSMALSEELWQPSSKLESLTTTQQKRLSDYSMLIPEKGTVAIPISRAMKLVVAELSQPVGDNTASDDTTKEQKND